MYLNTSATCIMCNDTIMAHVREGLLAIKSRHKHTMVENPQLP